MRLTKCKFFPNFFFFCHFLPLSFNQQHKRHRKIVFKWSLELIWHLEDNFRCSLLYIYYVIFPFFLSCVAFCTLLSVLIIREGRRNSFSFYYSKKIKRKKTHSYLSFLQHSQFHNDANKNNNIFCVYFNTRAFTTVIMFNGIRRIVLEFSTLAMIYIMVKRKTVYSSLNIVVCYVIQNDQKECR